MVELVIISICYERKEMVSIYRKKILVNKYEEETYKIVNEIRNNYNFRVFPKVRIADVLDIDSNVLSREEANYAFKAHFDFVIQPEDEEVAFIIEFDEKYHSKSKKAFRNDKLKNEICKQLELPYIRVGIDSLQKVGSFTILSWLIGVWFLSERFWEAQKSGYIPLDELFDPNFIVEGNSPKITFPYDLMLKYKRFLWAEMYGGNLRRFPTLFNYTDSEKGNTHSVAIHILNENYAIMGFGTCRSFENFPIIDYEISDMLALMDFVEKYKQYLLNNNFCVPLKNAIDVAYFYSKKMYPDMKVTKTDTSVNIEP